MSRSRVVFLVVASLLTAVGTWWWSSSTATARAPAASARAELQPRSQPSIPSIPDDAGDVAEVLPAQMPQTVAQPVAEAEQRRRDAVRSLTLDQALDRLAARATKQGTGLQEVWPELAAWFDVHPDQIAPAVEALRTGTIEGDQTRMSFYIALGNARVPEAKAALLGIKRDSNAPPLERTRAIFNLIDRHDVGTDFARELASDSKALVSSSTRDQRFLSTESLLALSTMSGRRTDAEIHSLAESSVREVLSMGDGRSQRVALKALANTGDVTLLDEGLRFSRESDPETREAAASIFRRMPPKQTDALAASWLSREGHPFVKAKLYRVLRSQHFDAHQPASRELVSQALSDLPATQSMITRKFIIRLVGSSSVAQEQDVRAALVQQARWEFEHHTELINEFTGILTPEETWTVLR